MNLKKTSIFSILCFLSVVFVTLNAFAAERIYFDRPLSQSSLYKIQNFDFSKIKLNPDTENVAKTDLNGDGLSEFIVRDERCTADKLCLHAILAESGKSLHVIGLFEARTILIGEESSAGVRNLLVFKTENNDFDYVIWSWDPLSSAYKEASL